MAGKKARKPYTITRPRERWAADEHDRFLHALVLLGRDWKRIESFVATKTSTQIRSHAQKYFLKAQKLGIAVAPPLPRRAAVLAAQPPVSCAAMLSPDDLYFAQVYRFVGDIFGSDAPQPVETELQRLLGADPVVVDTIFQVLENIQENMFLN
ncbi:unnamed protein product [Urochloa decumbens]|uniref:HTH myb-type domain-containing protein n=1 Tax=Urochloa decumbens TaxID=240449 RepID=A0ABC8X5V8_9POAL